MTSPTIDTQSLESLLERVRGATGPDRELDAAMMICQPVATKDEIAELSEK